MSTISTVAAYEFRRVFKLKDVFLTLGIMVLGAVALGLFRRMDSAPEQDRIVLVGTALDLEDSEHLPFRFERDDKWTEATGRKAVEAGELDATLLLETVEGAQLIVRDEKPGWLPELRSMLTAARRADRLRQSSIPPAELEALLAEAPLELSFEAPQEAERKGKNKLAAILSIVAMIFGLFLGTAHLFTGITGEKQNHVTESVLAAIPVQSWIDGKLLGIGAVSLGTLLTTGLSGLLANGVFGFFAEPIHIPLSSIDLGATGLLLAVVALGFLMWFAFFAAIAATIDDPNTSARGVFLLVPAGITALAFTGLDAPDTPLFRLASMFPLTSPGAMPVRLIAGRPSAWELAVCLALLVAATWAFRRLAGKIFGTAMLMRGKDLAWSDMWRSFRAS